MVFSAPRVRARRATPFASTLSMGQAGHMSSLPFPIRLAAGVIATSLDLARRLPAELPTIGVKLAGTAARAALQVRNEVTELMIRGDELLDRPAATQEKPPWATFDDDDEQGEPDDLPTQGPREQTSSDGPFSDSAFSDDAPIADYDSLTLAQVRVRLSPLSLDELRRLLVVEERGAARPAFLTLIGNRLTTVERTGS